MKKIKHIILKILLFPVYIILSCFVEPKEEEMNDPKPYDPSDYTYLW